MIYKFKEYEKSELLRKHLNLGGTNPQGERIDVTSLYIERNGKPCIPVMGEYHFSRDNRDNWYHELCKMRAGGVNIVATYLFMIYHEEDEGIYDFTGDLDIRRFVLDAKRAGMEVVLRVGPWAHGECRNGGFPDWLLKKPYELRDSNPEYMSLMREWLTKIYEQVQGLFYSDGGNIIGVQIENEFVDNAEHLLDLKKLAVEIGYDVPLYTVTGWNSKFGAKIPVDDVLPVFGAYPEAPWTGHTDRLPLSPHYVFNKMRNDSAIGNDQIAAADEDGWQLPYERYPFATCELGGGIEITHHRRPIIEPMDIYALSLVKLGSGNNLIGYYMYHGGINKIGKYSTLNESKVSGYPNDYPIISYDFQAPISEYGEPREHYGLLNMLHLFVEDFGDILAPMEAVESEAAVSPEDMTSLRYCMRTDGKSGFVFINNYQRLAQASDKTDVVIDTGSVMFPNINVKSGASFIMPFNIPLGSIVLEYATAQLLCKTEDTYFFAAVDGIAPEFKLSGDVSLSASGNSCEVFTIGDTKIAVIPMSMAARARRIDGKLYFGDVYGADNRVCNSGSGIYSYKVWNGNGFDEITDGAEAEPAKISFTDCEPFEVKYIEELELGGKRALTFKKLSVTNDLGFVEIPFECDAAQIYADGELVADEYYYGKAWRVPAALIYGKEAFLVYSEMKDDFYREF